MTRASCLPLAGLLFSAAAAAQAPPASRYLVINNTRVPLICTYRIAGGAVQSWSSIAPAANWVRPAEDDAAAFQCRRPVRQVRYTIRPGKRYSLIRTDSGEVVLIEVTAGERRPR
ncbi:MAG: hypothetical protein ACJ8E3_06005 [Sphingomicrobium sp.]